MESRSSWAEYRGVSERSETIPVSAIDPIVRALPTRAAIDCCILERLGL